MSIIRNIISGAAAFAVCASAFAAPSHGHNYLASSHKKDEIFIMNDKGEKVWSHSVPHPQDVWMLKNGNIVTSWAHGVYEMTKDKKIVWEYKVEPPYEVPSVQPIEGGKFLVSIDGQCRLVEIKDGKEVHSVQMSSSVQINHGQLRMCRKTRQGTYLAPLTAEGVVREYDRDGKVLREFPHMASPVNALRLKNGNTLISGSGRVTEFADDGSIVWEINPETDTPGINMAVPAGIQRLENGNTIVCNWGTREAGDKKAVHIFEITPDKRIVWEVLSDDFGDVAHCQLLTDKLKPVKNIER